MSGPHIQDWLKSGTALLLAALAAAGAAAQEPAPPTKLAAADLTEMTLEQLGNILVTTVSKREERLSAANAAIFVITAEDIRRSGALSLPEVLRLAPNLDVARADANTWAISARGFNTLTANNLLVLIDGRTVYSILFSGVFWESQHVMLEDIERIEVISGPGTTLWGANAVNGVINVITRRAADTQGMLVTAGGSARERAGAARVGGALPGGHYRLWARYVDLTHTTRENGPAIRDESETVQVGARADFGDPDHGFTLQGDFYESDIDQVPRGREASGFNLLGRWQHRLDNGASLRLQGYFDRADRDVPTQYGDRIDTWDLEFQHALPPGPTHHLIWGGGSRLSRDRFMRTPVQGFSPDNRDLRLANVFVQDNIALTAAMELTLGVKLERNSYTGTEVLPNARIAWRPASDWTMWAALSRALRTPSRLDRDYDAATVMGNPDYESEVTEVLEGGFRSQPTSGFSYTFTAFHNRHDRIRSIEAGPGRLRLANNIEGRTNGVGVWGSWQATRHWRLAGGGGWQDVDLWLKAGSRDPGIGVTAAGNDPSYWAQLRSSWDIGPRHELDVSIRHVGARPNPDVPRYTAVNLRAGWKVARGLELSLIVKNALDARHVEWGNPANRAEFARSAFLRLTWQP